MLPADIGFVSEALDDIDVDEGTIRQIVSILEENVDSLNGSKPGTLSTASLGGSDTGAQLGYHTSLAHKQVVEAMEQMVVGLKGYAANIHRFHQEIDFSDDTSSSAGAVITGKVNGVTPTVLDSTNCTSAPDVTPNSTCTIPTGDH